jgi:hypothetical protein
METTNGPSNTTRQRGTRCQIHCPRRQSELRSDGQLVDGANIMAVAPVATAMQSRRKTQGARTMAPRKGKSIIQFFDAAEALDHFVLDALPRCWFYLC